MEILKYYNDNRMPYALSNLTAGKSVIDIEDAISEIENPNDIMKVLNNLYYDDKIYDLPLEVKKKDENTFRIKLKDAWGNITYLEIGEK